jgi:xylulokinase
VFLGIDCGTQGTKAILVDRQGNRLGAGYAAHALTERDTGAREQEPTWWIAAAQAAMADALGTVPASEVLAIGVSGQQHGLVVLDETMQIIRPAKLWSDTETSPQNEALIQRFGGREQFLERFGILPLTGYTASKLLWLAENEPENFTRIRHILLPHEYLNFWLTGKLRAEFGDASGTAYFDVRSRTWAREVLDAIDGGRNILFPALPELIPFDKAVGHVRPEIQKEFGFAPGCLVSSGGGDNMMGAIGTGNVSEGIVTLSLGTSSTVYGFRDGPANDPTGRVAPFCSSSGGWLPLVCTMNATNVVTATIKLLGKAVADIDSAMEATAPGAGGLVFIPFLNGERTPDLPQATGTLLGLTSTNFTGEHLIRSAVEGVSFGILNGLRLIHGDGPLERIRLIGGGARSAAWRQMLADATGAIIEVPTEEEAGCLGAAIQAMYVLSVENGQPESMEEIAARTVHFHTGQTSLPRPELREPYRVAAARYAGYLQQIYGVTAG